MDAATQQELAELRRRAYAPGGDIDSDPAAVARLRRLESAERAATNEARLEEVAEDEDVEFVGLTELVDMVGRQALVSPRSREPDAADAAPDRARWAERGHRPRALRWALVWAASLVVVALLVAGGVAGVAALPPWDAAQGRQVATLDEPVDFSEEAVAQLFGSADTQGFGYLGLIVLRTGPGVFSEDQDCLAVADAASVDLDDGMIEGPMPVGCAAGGFPAMLPLVVSASSPRELRERFVDGTGLRFVLDGELIGVFSDDGRAATGTPEPDMEGD